MLRGQVCSQEQGGWKGENDLDSPGVLASSSPVSTVLFGQGFALGATHLSFSREKQCGVLVQGSNKHWL